MKEGAGPGPCQPPVTVLVCTLNRVAFLRDLLDSLARCERFGDILVIVVDNGCTDSTGDICRLYAERHPNISRIVEPRLGLSWARNAGLRAAETPYILFLDDDCTVGRDFLRRALATIQDHAPDFFGGPIVPCFDGVEPAWLRHLEKAKVHQPTTGFHPKGRLAGGNFGMRRDLVETLGYFATDLGMRGGRVGVYEEKDLLDRYFASTPDYARRIYYDLGMPIHHRVLSHKFRKRYHLRRAFLNGVAEVRSAVRFGGRRERLVLLRRGLRSLGRELVSLADRRGPPVIVGLVRIGHQAGRLAGVALPRLLRHE